MTDKVLCRYFALNACKKGDACPFSHNLKDQPSNVCTFYLRGNCSYGTNCRYEHVSARKLAETQGWGPLAAKLAAGGSSPPQNSPPSVLSPAPGSEHGTSRTESMNSASETGAVGGRQGELISLSASNPGKSWAELAAKPNKETKPQEEMGTTKGRAEETKGRDRLREKDGAENGTASSMRAGDLVHQKSDPESGILQKPDAEELRSDNGAVEPDGQLGCSVEPTENLEEEFDVQQGAWRPPNSEGGSTPDFPQSISPALNSSAQVFSPSNFQDGGHYMPAPGYPPHVMQTPGGPIMLPAYGADGIAYEDNHLPDELWDWVDQMTITDQDDYAAMQGIAYVPGQPYPQSYSPTPPIGYMYPQSYSPVPLYPHQQQQYPQPYPDGSYPQSFPDYHANPPPEAPNPESKPAEDTPNPDLINDSLEDFPHLASADSKSAKEGDQPICPFAAAGECPREKDGGTCSHLHGDTCPSCGKRCLHPHRPEERKEHLEGCERRVKRLKQLQRSQEVECCVCLERVLTKPRIAERKFGILSGCDHAFCIACIRGWRSGDHTTPGMDLDSVVRSCPVCRVQSFFVTPSVVWYSSSEEKQQIMEGYKRKLKAIDCRHFNYGDGSCPFGTSCFYRHRFKDGREEEVALRHLGTADGTVTIAKSVRLSDFIDLTALKKRR